MKQALHILRKDARHLRRDVAAMLGVSVVFVLLQPVTIEQLSRWSRLPGWPRWDFLDLMLTGAALYLVCRAVLAEPIPGEDRFWLTRPYRRSSLLAAKLAFVLLFVALPMVAAEGAALIRSGMPLALIWDNLVFSGIVIFLSMLLPVTAAAAMASSLRALFLGGILVGGLYLSVTTNIGSVLPAANGMTFWLRSLLEIAAITSASAVVIGIQYFRRATWMSIRVAGTLSVVTLIALWNLPIGIATAAETAIAGNQVEESRLAMRADAGLRSLSAAYAAPGLVELDIPLVIDGLPSQSALDVHEFHLELIGPNGIMIPESLRLSETKGRHLEARVRVPSDDFDAAAGRTVRLRVVMAASVFARPQQSIINVGESYAVITPDGLVCRREPTLQFGRDTEPMDRLRCRSQGDVGNYHVAGTDGSNAFVPDYSPFPRPIALSRLADFTPGRIPSSASSLTLVLRERVGHFYLEFEIPIDLEDYRLS